MDSAARALRVSPVSALIDSCIVFSLPPGRSRGLQPSPRLARQASGAQHFAFSRNDVRTAPPSAHDRCQRPLGSGLMVGADVVTEAELRGRGLRVATAPYFSVFMAVRDAVGAERCDTPPEWRDAIRPHLTRGDHEVLAPLATAHNTYAPNAILPFPETPGQTVEEALEQILAAEERLVRDIHECVDLGPTGDWRQAARDPRRWVRDFILAIARAWIGFRPIWQQAGS